MSTRPKNPNLVQARDDQDDDINFDGTMVNKVSPLDEAFSERTVVMPRSQAPDYMPPTPRLGSVPPPAPAPAPTAAPIPAPPTFVARFEAVKVPPAPAPKPVDKQEMFGDEDVTAPGRAPAMAFTPPPMPPPMPTPLAVAPAAPMPPPVSPVPKPAASAMMNQWQSAPAGAPVEAPKAAPAPATGGWRDALLKNQEELKLEPQLTPPPPHPVPERPNSGSVKMPTSLQPYVAPVAPPVAPPIAASAEHHETTYLEEDTDLLPFDEAPKANRSSVMKDRLRGLFARVASHPALDRFKALPRYAQVGIIGFSLLLVIVLVKVLDSSPEPTPVAAAPVVQKPVVEAPPVAAVAPKVVQPGTGPDAVLSQFDAAFFKTQSQARDGL